MKQASFEHNGVTYTLRAPSIFDTEMRGALLIDLAKVWCKEHEIDFESIPNVIDRLLGKYTDWMPLTTVTKSVAHVVNAYVATPKDFDKWREAVLDGNHELAIKWAEAYQSVTEKDDDPKNANGDGNSEQVSETTQPVAVD